MFDVRRLVVFREVVRTGSLSAAAAALSYTTSAVSQQIAALEREVGVALLVRGPSGARPTPAGRRLLEHTGTILAAIERAERDLASPDSTETLRVASFSSAAAAILPAALSRLRAAHPGLRPSLVGADPDEGVALLNRGEVDAAMVTEVPGERPLYVGVVTAPVYDDEFYVVLPRRHRLAALNEVALADLADEEWVVSSATGSCPDTRVFQNACRSSGFTPSVTFRPEDYSTVQGLVAANLGVSLVPSLAAAQARNNVAVRRVAGPRPVRRISMATAAEPCRDSALATLVSLVQAVGARLANDAAYSVPARPFSVA
ncbi:LysR substrate-binding domain-containing protein [Mycobacterium sp. ACS4331]|uniref:LysR substrate-binding domain-containing protein n=1 Tax=Mycobacterium sp. ACS4331 TaxID=1834121 RepID=UPI00080070B2|nr:LysR substrate-binding domain-containing protein [Mycobacterium sp. ACS4331]OBF16048.1 LysR family transcriptional regulator [Mycobacterium sp. ACS4331]